MCYCLGRGRIGGLAPDFFEDLLQELWEGGGFAGTEDGEGTGLDLSGPVVGVRVECVQDVFLDSA